MWTFIDLHLAFFLSALFVWTYLALCDWLFCATFSLLALLKWELQPRFIISTLILSSSLTFPVPSRGSTYWSFRLSCLSLPLNFWPRFTFSSSVILLCFFRPGLAQFLGHTLSSLLDCHPNSLPALLHLATLQKSLSKLGLDRGNSDLSTIIMGMIFWFSSVQFSRVWPSVTPQTAARQAPRPLLTPRVYSNLRPLSWWCHPPIASSVVPFSSHLQSFPASRSFQMSQFFASGGQRIGVLASASVLPMNIQDWFPLGWAGWISLQSKGLSKVFSNTTIQKHQFFGADFW